MIVCRDPRLEVVGISDSTEQPLTHLNARLLLKRTDQPTRTGIMFGTLARFVQLRLNLLCQTLAQLDAPLVEAVDIPDGALGEGHVLVVGDEGAEGAGGDFLREDGGRGSVAQESFVRDEVGGGAFGLYFVRGFADHEGFGLGEEVGGEHSVGEG